MESFAGAAVIRHVLPWVLERTEGGRLTPRYLGVTNSRLAWTCHCELAMRFADKPSAAGMLIALNSPPFGSHLNGTERPVEMACG